MNPIDGDKVLEWANNEMKEEQRSDGYRSAMKWLIYNIEKGSFAIKEDTKPDLSELTHNDQFQLGCLIKEHGVDYVLSAARKIGYDMFIKEDTPKQECDWCGEPDDELSHPHTFDMAPGAKMCRRCWNHDREAYKGRYGEDIGEFKPVKEEQG